MSSALRFLVMLMICRVLLNLRATRDSGWATWTLAFTSFTKKVTWNSCIMPRISDSGRERLYRH
ncbi:Uncharacterised protein [Vibrio cholerae]|nr:Uncharacterised protein [Vibrio cholerae]